MIQSVTANSLAAVIASAVLACLVVTVPDSVTEAKAQPAKGEFQHRHGKGDRLTITIKPAVCSLQGWPNYEQNCQFDLRTSSNSVAPVRIVAFSRS
jgi:hypothetical protein